MSTDKLSSRMRLLNMPTESIIKILIAATYSRGLKRALRLRLVCKVFKALFYNALFATDLLDEHASSGSLNFICSWYGFENRVPDSFYLLWQSYLSLRVQSPNRPLTPRMTIIKQTANSFRSEVGLFGEKSIEERIWTLSDIRIHESLESLFSDHKTPLKSEPHLDTRRALLVAAARTNDVSLAQVILEDWTTKDYVAGNKRLFSRHIGFRCPSYIAARYASNEVLDLLLQFKLAFKVPREAWKGCGLGGTQETLNVILKHRPKEMMRSLVHEHSVISEQQYFGLVTSRYPAFLAKLGWLWFGNIGISEPKSILNSKIRGGSWEVVLAHHASWGFSEMVEHLIKLGVALNASPGGDPENRPLRTASRGFHPDVVKMLLDYGADPNQCDALAEGAKSGSLRIVRILLEGGATVQGLAKQLVKISIRLEHTAMFNLLREHGALTNEAWEAGLEEASKEGLKSMMTLLQASGYDR